MPLRLRSAREAELIVQPILPVRDMAEAEAFYVRAGFDVTRYDDGYGWVHRNGRELFHLVAAADLDPDRNPSACYIHTADVDDWHVAWLAADLPVSELENQTWGMREFTVFDPSGNRLRVGTNI